MWIRIYGPTSGERIEMKTDQKRLALVCSIAWLAAVGFGSSSMGALAAPSMQLSKAQTAELSPADDHKKVKAKNVEKEPDSNDSNGDPNENAEAAVIQGTSPESAGTVRVNNLANLEALLNIIANGTEIMGMSSCGSFFISGIILCFKSKVKPGLFVIGLGVFVGIIAVATPGIINWLVASARDANLFS